MHLRTTLALFVLAAAGAAVAWIGSSVPKGKPSDGAALPESRRVLSTLTPANLSRIEIQNGERVTLLEKQGDKWSMPGGWPVREAEVKAIVETLGGLQSRFAPEGYAGDVARFGLKQVAGQPAPIRVLLRTTTGANHALLFGEPAPAAGNRFSTPTYVHVDDIPEVLRLAPGLFTVLDRPPDFYQQRRLFAAERVAKEGEAGQKIERLLANDVTAVELREPASDATRTACGPAAELHPAHRERRYRISRARDDWEMAAPVADRLDPNVRDSLLSATPDVWAERFVTLDLAAIAAAITTPDNTLSSGLTSAGWAAVTLPGRAATWLKTKTGLETPERTLIVQRENSPPVALLIGKVSSVRITKKPGRPMPGLPPGVPPPEETVREEYRYAQLKGNDQVFEIKADKLKDIFVDPASLRDARVARFNSADARRIEITQAGRRTVLVKEKDRWKLEEPLKSDADASKVDELLSKLSGLEARNEDVRDPRGPDALAPFGLTSPTATIQVEVEEEVKGAGDKKEKRPRVVRLQMGKKDDAAKKVYLRDDRLARVNAVDESLVPLVTRPALAYRGNRVFDFASADVKELTVTKDGKSIAFARTADGWRLASPVQTAADKLKADQLADGLAKLEVIEYLSDAPDAKQTEAEFGLGKPAVSVLLHVKEGDRPEKKPRLEIGKARNGKPGYFARLADAPGVFAINNDLVNLLEREALAYLPAQLWQLAIEDIAGVSLKKAGQEPYRVVRAGDGWKVSGPFDAAALPEAALAVLNGLAVPHADRYVAFYDEKDLGKYGLDKPAAIVTLTTKDGKEHVLRVGAADAKDSKAHFAQSGTTGAICVIGEPLVAAAERDAVALLDPVLVKLDPAKLNRVVGRTGDMTITIEKKGDAWQVIDGPGAPFTADEQTMTALLAPLLSLKAERIAAFGPKVDLVKYGLDKPAYTLTLRGPQGEHTIELGGAVPLAAPAKPNDGPTRPMTPGDAPDARFARVDKGPGIAVVSGLTFASLSPTRLALVNREMLKLEPQSITTITRTGEGALELTRRDGAWRIMKPAEESADDHVVSDFVEQLAGLRATRIVSFPAADLGTFGLDAPAATVTIVAGDKRHVLKIGKPANPKSDYVRPSDPILAERFAQLEGGKAVGVLPGPVARLLVAGPLAFRDRTLVRFPDADKLRLERGPRKATFARLEGSWKLTEPLAAEADQDSLDDFLNDLAKLRADEYVAEKPTAAELAKFGLDKPTARWRALNGDKEVLHLLVGNAEADSTRHYAKLADRDVVFLLERKLAGKALGEFRSRTVWTPPLDAAQVESLRYGYRENPFVLEKNESGQWQVIGKPELKLQAATVTETLDALAGLKLARYAVDRDAELPLYGLQPPELSLEIATRAGKRTLQIGRFEGESKRRYARIGDGARTDVFVLGEQDTAKIVRDPASFTRPPLTPPKPGPVSPRSPAPAP